MVSNKSAVTLQDYYQQGYQLGIDVWSKLTVTESVTSLKDSISSLTALEGVAVVSLILLFLRSLYLVVFSRKKQKSTDVDKDDDLLPMLCDLAKTAFTSGQAEKVIHMVETYNVDVNASVPQHGLNLVLCSCLSGNERLVEYMISKGGDMRRTTSAGDSCLYLATFSVINSGRTDCSLLEVILLAGCDVNRANSAGYTPLHRAAGGGQTQIVKLFLKYGANPRLCSTEGIYPLDIAINNGHLEAAGLLEIRTYNPYVWDVIDPHTPPHIKLGLQSPKRNHLVESSRQYCSPKLKVIR